jgi:hypothetical protein
MDYTTLTPLPQFQWARKTLAQRSRAIKHFKRCQINDNGRFLAVSQPCENKAIVLHGAGAAYLPSDALTLFRLSTLPLSVRLPFLIDIC